MAKLKVLPEQAIIDGFKGTIDFYRWMGLPVARKWPRSPGHDRSPAVQSTWPAFTYAARGWNDLSPEVQDAYRKQASGSKLSGRDLFMRSVLKGLYGLPFVPPKHVILYWFNNQIQIMADLNRVATKDWTDLDLSAHCPPSTVAVILAVHAHVDNIGAGSGNGLDLDVKRAGEPASFPVRFNFDGSSLGNGANPHHLFIVGLDTDRKLMYRIGIFGVLQVDTWLELLAYFAP